MMAGEYPAPVILNFQKPARVIVRNHSATVRQAAARSSGRVSRRAPRGARPTAVRTALTMTGSFGLLMAGAFGTLGVLLEVSIKVLPAPAVERNLVLNLPRDRAVNVMRELARQPAPLSGACHFEDRLYLRLSGNAASVKAWEQQIGGDGGEGGSFWQQLKNHSLRFFERERPLWRLSVAPATPRLSCEHETLTDWAGAQRWVHTGQSAAELRREVEKVGGHAILFRHGDKETPVFHPLDSVRERIHRGLKGKFDPVGILNPGRQYAAL